MGYFYDVVMPFLESKEPYQYLVILWLFSQLLGFCSGFLLAFIKRSFIMSSR